MEHRVEPEESLPAVSRSALWVRRFRRLLPFLLVSIVVVAFQPEYSGSEAIDWTITAAGFTLCMLGQAVRFWAWGSNAAAGKHGLRDRGPYALMRHPLYSGNFLIVLGTVVVFNNVWVYPLLLLPFAGLYRVIAKADETQMVWWLGDQYHNYKNHELPRFLPALHKFGAAVRTTSPFGWRLAWRKEYGSCCAWMAGVVGLEFYKRAAAQGWFELWRNIWVWIIWILAVTIGLSVTIRNKRRNTYRRRLRAARSSDEI
jgi:protein-S-isoprenylcysteine O-methyltransferase Ste14